MCGNCFGNNSSLWIIVILILLFSNCGNNCCNSGCGGPVSSCNDGCGCGC